MQQPHQVVDLLDDEDSHKDPASFSRATGQNGNAMLLPPSKRLRVPGSGQGTASGPGSRGKSHEDDMQIVSLVNKTGAKRTRDAPLTIDDDDDNGILDVVDLACAGGSSGGSSSAAWHATGSSGGARPASAPQQQAAGAFTLDACGCQHSVARLARQLEHTVRGSSPAPDQQHQPQQQGPSAMRPQTLTLLESLLPLTCPSAHCCSSLSSRDVLLLLGGQCTQRLYAQLCTALASACSGTWAGKPPSSPAAGGASAPTAHCQQVAAGALPVLAPSCSACGAAMVPAACIAACGVHPPATAGSKGARGQGAAAPPQGAAGVTLSVQELVGALQARGVAVPQKGRDAPGLAAKLQAAVGPGVMWLCPGCPTQRAASDGPSQVQLLSLQRQANAAARALSLLQRARSLLLGVEQEATAVSSPGGRSRAKGRKPAAPRKSAGNAAWAKGVGYGGGNGGETSAASTAAFAQALAKQQQGDEQVRGILVELSELLSSWTRGGAGRVAGGGTGRSRGGAASSMPPLLMAALQCGGLAYVLRLLLQNDSLLDLAQRQRLYSTVVALTRLCASSNDLLFLFTIPAADPRATPSTAAGEPDPSLDVVMRKLLAQCRVFKRSAQDLADGGQDDIAALGLSLELEVLCDEVAAGVAMWRSNAAGLADGPGLIDTHRQGQGGQQQQQLGQAPAGGAAAAAVQPGVPGCGTPAESLAARRAAYLETMASLRFLERPLLADHFFKAEATKAQAGGEAMRQRLRRITGELSSLATGLPLEWDSSIFLAADTERVDVLRALLLPAPDTPYANGAFIFDILLPPDYPNAPPKVQFLTTGGGRVRFNPNLYDSGKVCLSLLGTWSGPSWDPKLSTLMQVLVSIQAMVLVSDPYYNEPGWERQASTAAGRQAAEQYNQTQRYNTLAFAVLPALQMLTGHPGKLAGGAAFAEVLRAHYRAKRPELLAQADAWQASMNTQPTAKYVEGVVPQIKALLEKL